MENRTGIIVFGNVPLATWVIQRIVESKKIELVGVVCEEFEKNAFSHHNQKEPSVYYYRKKNKLPILSFSEAFEKAGNESVLGISVRYNKIFKEDYFNRFNPGIINLHGGDLPRYRGSNIANFAILEKAEYGAGTLHFIAKGIDEGDIVGKITFNVGLNETAYSFFQKTIESLKTAFNDFIRMLEQEGLEGINRTSQDSLIASGKEIGTYKRDQIKEFQEIDFKNMSEEEIERTARAFYFPPHEPAFIKVKDQKLYILPEEWR
jgi:methionyl-tRNA formyltransferase